MNTHRALALVLAAAAVSTLTFGSAGFTSVSADRDVSVSVVDTADAYIGVHACANPKNAGNHSNNTSNASNKTPVSVTITNRLPKTVTVVSITDAHGRQTFNQQKSSVGSGESHSFTVHAPVRSSLTVVVAADGVNATITSEVAQKDTCN